MNSTIVTIQTLSNQGEGIARVEGKATFIPFTLPGETWKVRITDSKKNFDRALPLELIERSEEAPERILPACPHFGTCGGCHLQHLPYADQLDWKRRWLQETFRRIAHLEVQPNPTVASPPWEYRNKLTLSLRNHRGGIVYTYHHVQQPNRWVAVEDCPIAHPLIRRILPIVLEGLNNSRPRISEKTRLNPLGSRVQFRVVGTQVGIVFFNTAFSPASADSLSEFIFKGAVPVAEINLDESEQKNLRSVSYTPDEDTENESGVSSDSFYQVNDTVRELLYQSVLDLPYRRSNHVLDGYCGVGILTRRLTGRFEKVTGVEMNGDAVNDALRSIEEAGQQDRVHILQISLEKYLENCTESFDCMVLNPPRVGLSEEVRRATLRHSPYDLAIVSCHPAALARDVKTFTDNGYRIQFLQPFDMFPQTFHLECVVFLQRENT